LSEAVRLAWALVEPGWDMVWIARPAIVKADFAEMQAACVRLLQRAGILKTA
jgi:ribonuclease P protein component